MKVVLFGTSADPPTIAHKAILKYLGNNYDLVAVYASDNPFKSHGSNLEHRSQMLKLVIEEVNVHHNIYHCQDISDRRTINTVAKAKQKWGQNIELTMVIGSDLAPQIFSWYQAEKLWQNLKVLLIPREGYVIESPVVEKINERSLGCTIASCQIPPFSSTDYRHNHDLKVLTDRVKIYIQEHKLYLNDTKNC